MMARENPSGSPSPSVRPCDRHGETVDFGGQRIATGPCVDRDGQTIAHTTYVLPSRRNPILRWSLVAAAVPTTALIALFFVGAPARSEADRVALRRSLSPGDTIGTHNLAKLDCAQCHRAWKNVEDVRCERCHDPLISARLTNAGHVFQGTGDLRQALIAPQVACVTCHVEHRGQNATLADVDDRECGTCHRADRSSSRALATLARHPEFAIVRAGVEVGSGLRWFNHETHLRRVYEKYQTQCETCHQRPDGGASFSPIAFSKHCADCHEKDLNEISPGTVSKTTLAALGPLAPGLSALESPDDPTQSAIKGIAHEDPWVLSTVQSLRTIFDPAAVAADRLTLDRQVAQLELMTAFRPDPGRAGAWLDPGRTAVVPDATGSKTADAALRDGVTDLSAVLRSIEPLAPNAKAIADDAGRQSPATASAPASDGLGGATTSVDQVRRILDATIARAIATNNQSVLDRARALQTRLLQLKPAADGQGQVEAPLDVIRPFLRELRGIADPGVRTSIDNVDYLARLAQQQAATGIDPTAYDRHRQQTLRLLRAILADPRPADPRVESVRARATALERHVLATTYGTPPDLATARVRFFSARQADRTRVDTELNAAGILSVDPAPMTDDTASTARRLDQVRRRLLPLGSVRTIANVSTDDARTAIAALIGEAQPDPAANRRKKNRCALCHELSPSGDQLAPVRLPGGSLLVNATFTHQKHVTGDADRDKCVSCHTGILRSQNARDLNLPGIDSCRTCHAPGNDARNKTGCESCHKYHTPPTSALMWRP
jgi:hypothetical protein